jgi:exodeoxyribonuclease-3
MSFRIVVWNCNGALHEKTERLTDLRPDLAIIPECARPDALRAKAPGFKFSGFEWQGDDANKGLGVFAFGDVTLRRHESWDQQYHLFMPVEVRGPLTANLLAVWAFHHRAPQTVTPNPVTLRQAIAHYAPFLQEAPGIAAGDFNASVYWDKQKRYEPFAAADADLQGLGLESAYHAVGGHTMGAEPDATLFWQRNLEKRYHIDYAYLPKGWKSRIRGASVGTGADWIAHSDHAPVVIELDLATAGSPN